MRGISKKLFDISSKKIIKKDSKIKMLMITIISLNYLDIFSGCCPMNIVKLNIIKYPKLVIKPLSFLEKSLKIILQ